MVLRQVGVCDAPVWANNCISFWRLAKKNTILEAVHCVLRRMTRWYGIRWLAKISVPQTRSLSDRLAWLKLKVIFSLHSQCGVKLEGWCVCLAAGLQTFRHYYKAYHFDRLAGMLYNTRELFIYIVYHCYYGRFPARKTSCQNSL